MFETVLMTNTFIQMTRDGVPVRLIPSLDGGLYQYDGESIEAIPLTADSLLSSSFKLADDTTMVGGKDLHTYGINPYTGQVSSLLSSGVAVSKKEQNGTNITKTKLGSPWTKQGRNTNLN